MLLVNDKRNAHHSPEPNAPMQPITTFRLYARDENNLSEYLGHYYAPKHNASNDECINAALKELLHAKLKLTDRPVKTKKNNAQTLEIKRRA